MHQVRGRAARREREQQGRGDQQRAVRRDRHECRRRGFDHFERDGARGARLFAQARALEPFEERLILSPGDIVIAVELGKTRLDLRRCVHERAQARHLALAVADIGLDRRDFDLCQVVLQLNALEDRIRVEPTARRRATIATTRGLDLGPLTILQLLDCRTHGDDVRVFVRESQQQLIETRLGFADTGGGIAGDAARHRAARRVCRTRDERLLATKLALQLIAAACRGGKTRLRLGEALHFQLQA